MHLQIQYFQSLYKFRHNDILSLAPSVAKFNITESIGWPYETKGITLDRWYGVPVTLESNVENYIGKSLMTQIMRHLKR